LSSLRRFEPSKLPSPWRGVLERELGKLKARSDVIALGLCGSVAQNDIWPGSDLDIEVVVRGDRPKEIFTTEQEVSVDYGFLLPSLSLALGMRLFGKRSMPYWIEARRSWAGPKLRSLKILTRPLRGLLLLPNGWLRSSLCRLV